MDENFPRGKFYLINFFLEFSISFNYQKIKVKEKKVQNEILKAF
jgi:hypothetical protein